MEVSRGDRRGRRSSGKTDTVDAEAAAGAVLGGQTVAVPAAADGIVEMIREIEIARDTARKARTGAIVTREALIVTVPDELGALAERCQALER